jgi:hypothetical protein
MMAKQSQTAGGASVGDGMAQTGVAVSLRAAFMAGLASHTTEDFDGVPPSTTTYYRAASPLSLWGGLGSLYCETATDTFSTVVNGGVSVNAGCFNTSANASGNWYEAGRTFRIDLSSARNSFSCYITDNPVAGVGFEFLYNDILVATAATPTVTADKPAANEALFLGFGDGNIIFNAIRVIIRQATLVEAAFDKVGFDDLQVGLVTACEPAAGELYRVFARQVPQYAGGVNAVAPTAGPAWQARQNFLAHITGGVVETFESQAANDGDVYSGIWYDESNPLPILSGGGTLTQADTFADGGGGSYTGQLVQRTMPTNLTTSSGRWNTTAGGQKYWQSPRRFTVNLTAPRSAFYFYCTDLLDFLAGYLELQFFLGGELVHREIVAGEFVSAPFISGESLAFYGIAFAAATFDRVVFVIAQTTESPGQEDWQGFDDLGVGTPLASMFLQPNQRAKPTQYAHYGYGRRITYDLSPWIYAPFSEDADWPHEAKQNYDDFVAQATTPAVLTFESLAPATIVTGAPVATAFPAPLATLGVTISAPSTDTAIANETAFATWNTTPGGSKLLTLKKSVAFTFSDPIRSIGFYVINKNKKQSGISIPICTLRITLTKLDTTLEIHTMPLLTGSVISSSGLSLEGNNGGAAEMWGLSGTTQYTAALIEVVDFFDTPVTSYHPIGIDDLTVGV